MEIPKLMIQIPQDHMNTIMEMIANLKSALIYLETPSCRSYITEEQRRRDIKEVTEQFRRALFIRDAATFNSSISCIPPPVQISIPSTIQ